MDLVLILLQLLRLGRSRKITLLLPKSSSRGSTPTSISTSLEKETHIGHGRLFNEFALRKAKVSYTPYSRRS